MLRVMRLKGSELAPEWQDAAKNLGAFINSLSLPPEVKSLIADRDEDGEYLNFYSPSEGLLEPVPMLDGKPVFPNARMQAKAHYEERRDYIMQLVEPIIANEKQAHLAAAQANGEKGDKPLSPSPALLLKLLLNNPQHMIIVNETVPVIVPYIDTPHLNAALAQNPSLLAAGATAAASGSGIRWGLIGLVLLLLLLALGLAWYFMKLWPWPFIDEAKEKQAQDLAALEQTLAKDGLVLLLLLLALGLAWYFMKLWPWPFIDEAKEKQAQDLAALEQTLAKDQALLKEINDLIDKTDLRLELANELNRNDKLNGLVDSLKQDQQNLNEIDKLIAQTDALEQSALKAEQDRLAADKVAQEKATVASTTAKLPKCEVIKKQGKMPQLVMATDGSGSMLHTMSDRSFRIDAAMKAANALVDSVDKNVPIRLFGIQGCPLARDYGVFSGANRGALKKAIARTDPRLVTGMLPIEVLTPLVSALRGMANSVPANVDAVGILISDGVDTCNGTEHLNLCDVAEVLTPLVSALRGMANSVPANVDAVGILISDGVDTCNGTEHLNLCDVARTIHAQRPKLKINVILIGDDVEEAKCIASITGGKVYRPQDSVSLVNDLKNAAQRPKLKINVILIGDDVEEAKCIASITGGKVYRPQDSVSLVNDLKNAGSSLVKVCQ